MRNNERGMGMSRIFGAAAMAALGAAVAGCSDLGPEGGDRVERVPSAITGGSLVTENVFPYSAVVRLKAAQPCSGFKIGPRRFVTAAHCMVGYLPGDRVQLNNRLDEPLGLDQRKTLAKVDIHPSWVHRKPPHDYFDISVFEIEEDTHNIPALPLRTEPVPYVTPLTAVGYGLNAYLPGQAGKKQWAPFLSSNPNNEDIDLHNLHDNNGTTWNHEGDSGGPWLVENPQAVWKVAGVTSRGHQPSSLASRNGSVNRWIASPAQNFFASGEIGFFLNGKSMLCLSIIVGSPLPGAQAIQFFCDGRNQPNDYQSWQLGATGASRFNLRNRNSGLCLGVAGGSPEDGALIQQFGCVPSPNNNQSWSFVHVSGDFYQIVNAASGKCMGVEGGSFNESARLAQFPCTTDGAVNNQSWLFTR
jgi:hypothetical protein